MSWAEINREEKAPEVDSKAHDHFCELAYKALDLNPDGKKFFEIVCEQLWLPVCPHYIDSREGDQREGMNELIRQMKKAIAEHKKLMGGAK